MRSGVMIVIGLSAALSSAVSATTPQETIKARQANYKAIGRATKTVMDEVRKPTPDLAVIRPQAAQLATLSAQLPDWFPRGTGPEAGVKTAALPAIWTKPAEFRTAAVNFNRAARTLRTAAAGNDTAAVTAAARAMGATCKGCHDNFKAKDD